ncbi:MAG: 3-phosphoshikimate 1-carboxyvinyltransferase [bacterium]|nr:3-phosphoshikimate 1-carboxyvinyltransferase [bacterium]
MDSYVVPKLSLEGKSFSVRVPSSKSMANRALILAAQTKGDFLLKGDFAAEDIQLMVEALRKIGVGIVEKSDSLCISNDLSWRRNEAEIELYLGNSGTSLRFLTSLVCLRKGNTVLTGKERMKERPIKDLVDALRQLKVRIEYLEKDGFPPIRVVGSEKVIGGSASVRGDVSSQFITSLLLCAPSFEEGLRLKISDELISKPYVDLTLYQLREWGAVAESSDVPSEFHISRSVFSAANREIEGDASAAVYWWALGFLHGAEVTITNVPLTSLQPDLKFVRVLELLKKRKSGQGEFEIDMNDMPDASLMLIALGATLDYPIRITGIGSLRVKETDRIAAMAAELVKVGSAVDEGTDWIRIGPLAKELVQIVQIDTYDDHRVAMAMAILGTKLGNLEISDPDCVNKTYPGFWSDLERFTS